MKIKINYKLFSIFLISIFFINSISAFGFNVDTSGTTINVNVQQTIQNLSDMNDVNSSINPTGNDILTFDSGTSTWTSKSAQSVGDTNETVRFTNLVNGDCPSGKLVIGVQNNGTVLCATDSTATGGTYNATYDKWAYNQTYSGSTYNATYNKWAYNQSDGTGTGNASWNESYATTLYSDTKWGYNQTDIYTAGTNITISSNVVSLNVTALRNWLDQVYQATGNYISSYLNIAMTNQSNTFSGNQVFTDNITVNKISGDGSGLTNLPSGSLDGNASSICSSDQVLLGNGSCQTSSDFFDNTNIGNDGITLNILNITGNDDNACSGTDKITNVTFNNGNIQVTCGADVTGSGGKSAGGNYLTNTSTTISTDDTALNTAFNQTQTILDSNSSWLSTYNVTYDGNIDTTIGNCSIGGSCSNVLYNSDLPLTNRTISDWTNITSKPFISINTTQLQNNLGTLTILESWLTTFINNWFGGKTTDNLAEGITNKYDNQTFNETYTDTLYSTGSHTSLTNVAFINQTNVFAENQNFSKNITLISNNKFCLNTACSRYIMDNGSAIIEQG